MPQAVVLGTKRDRGLSCRGATLCGPGEQCGKKCSQAFHTHSYLTHHPSLPPSNSPAVIVISINSPSVMEHVCTHILILDGRGGCKVPLPPSRSLFLCLSLAFIDLHPAPQSAKDHIWSAAAQSTQGLPVNSRIIARTNKIGPEGVSPCYPMFNVFLSSSAVPPTISGDRQQH